MLCPWDLVPYQAQPLWHDSSLGLFQPASQCKPACSVYSWCLHHMLPIKGSCPTHLSWDMWVTHGLYICENAQFLFYMLITFMKPSTRSFILKKYFKLFILDFYNLKWFNLTCNITGGLNLQCPSWISFLSMLWSLRSVCEDLILRTACCCCHPSR